MTAVMFFAGAWGYLQLLKLPVPPGQASTLPAGGGSLLSNSTALLALAALVGTAIVALALTLIRWVSPLAVGLPGVLLLGWTALYLVSVRRAVEYIPLRSHSFGAGWEALLFNGVLGAVGVAMIVPMLIPSRWRVSRNHDDADLIGDADDFLAGVKPDDRGRREEQGPLVGTVVGERTTADGLGPVDITRITGASRALRTTGSYRAATGTQPRATGGLPRATGGQPRMTGGQPRMTGGQPRMTGGQPRVTGGQPRATGSFRGVGTGAQRRPYPAGDE